MKGRRSKKLKVDVDKPTLAVPGGPPALTNAGSSASVSSGDSVESYASQGQEFIREGLSPVTPGKRKRGDKNSKHVGSTPFRLGKALKRLVHRPGNDSPNKRSPRAPTVSSNQGSSRSLTLSEPPACTEPRPAPIIRLRSRHTMNPLQMATNKHLFVPSVAPTETPPRPP